MRHRVFGRKLSRSMNERRRLFMVLARQLIRYGMVETSLAKAKAIQPLVEKLVTKAKSGTDSAKRQIMKNLSDFSSMQMLLSWASNRFSKRNSGFTRIIKLGARFGDGTEKAELSFVDPLPVVVKEEKKEVKKVVTKVVTKPKAKPKPKAKKAVK